MDGWRVPGFTELRELGAGAQGRAVLVREEASGRVAVLKYVFAAAQPAAREMFRRESALLKRVRSPHVAGWYGHFEDAAGSAILMEAVDGVSLKDALARFGTLAPEAALVVLKGSLLGLAAAHGVGVVHRDYKPANVIVQGDGRSKLIDFGVAVYAGEGSRSGTPAYMAPEQWRGEFASPATDVYAATCVFFECVTGRRPYEESDPVVLMGCHVSAPVPVEAVPEPLRALVGRGMAKSGADRPEGALALAAELETVATGAYGPDWEERGVAALSTAAAALAALFPIAALLAPGSAGAAGAAGVGGQAAGLAAKLGSAKIALAIAAATAAATAGGAAVYNAAIAQPPKKHPAAAVSRTPTPPGVRLTFDTFSIVAPVGWKVRRDKQFKADFGVIVSGDCKVRCKGFQIFGPAFLVDTPGYTDSSGSPNQIPIGPYKPAEPYTARYFQDEGYPCPLNPKLRSSGGTGANRGGGARLLKNGLASVGSHRAEYREWSIPCWTEGPNAGEPVTKTNMSYVERDWYLPDSRILVVDEWNTPDLDRILAQATWL